MTERKPPGVPFESWADHRIREAQRRGEFDRLPGRGEPLPADLESPYDELWWLRRKLAREGVTVLPPASALRKEAEDTLAAALDAPSERTVRALVEAVNVKIRAMMFRPPPGPPLGMKPFDVEAVVRQWRAGRERRTRGEQGERGGRGPGRASGGE